MLDELFIRGGPVLYILFGLTFIIFALLIEKYIFIFIKSTDWISEKLNDFLLLNPPSETKHKFVESTLISNVKRKTSSTKMFLIHGDLDAVVSPTFLLETKDFLIRNSIEVETKMIKNCEHQIPIEASSEALRYIKNNFKI